MYAIRSYYDKVKTRFQGKISRHRVVDARKFDFEEIRARITSYNVCYTKLLRAPCDPSPSPVSAPAAPPQERSRTVCLTAQEEA